MKYLGIDNTEWTFMSEEAESMLLDKDIGQHVIGLYPFGNRLYGSENDPVELLCIYLDLPNKLLDPFEQQEIRGIYTSQNGHKIFFCSLFEWVKSLDINNATQYISEANSFMQVVPVMLESQYEDPQFSVITSVAYEYLKKIKWGHHKHTAVFDFKNTNKISKFICSLRAELILKQKNIFAPCLNKDWDTIEEIITKNDRLQTIDEMLINSFNNNSYSISTSDYLYYVNNIRKKLYAGEITASVNIEKNKLSHLVKTFLASLL